ncbi:MAG: phosphomethylpyrimidine synthase ThiC [Candidatus Omnitrophica bacterium]|nr:phosphomethylpyrimidine synthase ThiC [Candidatus Omnitrophota bacterium]
MFKKSHLTKIAKSERVDRSFLERQLAAGRAVICLNTGRDIATPPVIGEGFKIKMNTNIGTSTAHTEIKDELKKLEVAQEAGTHTVMDLSVGGNIPSVRRKIIAQAAVPVGTVPIYETAHMVQKKKGDFEKMTFDDLFAVLEQQAKDGVDFFTLHAGILQKSVDLMKTYKRTGGVVSRGGALLARWMQYHGKENPLFTHFDRILDLAKQYRITISLGDALRPGAVADSTDQLQLAELHVLGDLVHRCRTKGVQVMVEGPGHIRLDEIALNMRMEKKICHGAPFYILGPLPTDLAAGYDHIASAIGGAIAAMAGADFLCVVTPAEHLRHPSVEDIRDGVIASRIAAHSVDLLRFPDEWEHDHQMSLARARRNWEKMFGYAMNEKKARKYRKKKNVPMDICTMCGEFCSLKISEKCDLLK